MNTYFLPTFLCLNAVKDCGRPPQVDFARILSPEKMKTTVGSVVNYTCFPGYAFNQTGSSVQSNRTLRCLHTGLWEKATLWRCKRKFCDLRPRLSILRKLKNESFKKQFTYISCSQLWNQESAQAKISNIKSIKSTQATFLDTNL